MTTYRRCGNRWAVNEVLSLQREYQLLEWDVQQIAEKHERSVKAILCKLEAEGFISSWNDARGFDMEEYKNTWSCSTKDEEDESVVSEDEEDESVVSGDESVEVDNLTERVWNLETSVKDIGVMVKQMFDNWVTKKSNDNLGVRAPMKKI